MRSNGTEGEGGKRRGKRRRGGRGGFHNSNAGFVMSPSAAPPAQVAPTAPAEELIETAVIENLPESWDMVGEDAPESMEPDIAVAVAEELIDVEFPSEPMEATQSIVDDDLLLLEELTRPDPPPPPEAEQTADESVSAAAESEVVAGESATAARPVERHAAPIDAELPTQQLSDPPPSDRQNADQEATVDSVPATNGESAGEQVVALQAELLEKDQLVVALTAQLEEAANRLDRLHRAGADRAPRRGGSALSAEALERQSELTDQVARLADAWDEWRAADQMAELGRKLDDLCHLVTQNVRAPVLPRDTTTPRLSESWSGEFTLPAPSPADKQLPKWEQMKAQLLGDSAIIDQPWDAPPAAEFVSGTQPEVDLGVVVEPLGEPPAGIKIDTADLETLKHAVEDRDEFISQLLRRLRSTPACRREPIDWATIANAPDDLRHRLEELEARFQELLRIEECDMSLERARLAREQARLEQLRRELEKNGGHGGNGSTSSENDDSRRERRWLRVFSFGGKRDDGLD